MPCEFIRQENYLYVANSEAHNILGYSINALNGALTPLSGSPFALLANPAVTDQPDRIAFDPAGKFAYFIANATIYSYNVDSATGGLTLIAGSSSGAAGTNPRANAVDPTGTIAYVVDATANQVSAYSIDGTTGSLTFVNGSAVATGQLRSIWSFIHRDSFTQ